MKWEQMSARQRYELIAKKVMGWITDPEWNYCANGTTIRTYESSADGFKSFMPSTDISAAWEVFQIMKTTPFSMRSQFMNALRYTVSSRQDMGEDFIAWVDLWWFVTPDDICLAALKACGWTEDAE